MIAQIDACKTGRVMTSISSHEKFMLFLQCAHASKANK